MTNNYTAKWFDVFAEPIQPEQTKNEIKFLTHYLPNPPYRTVLDVCCGQGRHSNLLDSRGYLVTGIDQKLKALEKAEQTSNGNTVYYEMDMRNLSTLSGSFDAVVNLWQSFGYYDAATNKDILKQMASKLNPKGRLVLDIYHRGFFEKYQGTQNFEKAGLNITETKSIDLPHQFYNQIKDNGLMLIVIKNQGGGDNLYLMRKNTEFFESVESIPCGFVQMTGEYQMNDLNPIVLENESELIELKNKEINKRPFWWGGKGEVEGPMSGVWCTLGIRSFLGITEPFFHVFKTEKRKEGSFEENYFGLWDKQQGSLVIAKNDCLISYGNSIAEEGLMENINRWVGLGMPTAACFDLKIYPIEYPLTAKKNQWIIKRRESQFLWSLPVSDV